MVIRKPYAFLIKYFRQIHILLLLLSGYIYYKVTHLQSFINGYIDTEIYNQGLDSIKNYVSPLLYVAVLLLLFGTAVILILLKQKNKPKLTYIFICIEYGVLLILFLASSSYFNGLNGATIHSAQIRLIRDFLTIFSIPQFLVFILLVVRILGIDLQKFGFQNDEEFLKASEEDREEIEIGIHIDKDIYINKAKGQLRQFKYYYFENKFILNIIITICSIILIFFIIKFAFSFKTYKQGKAFNANGYNITINNVYTSKYNSSGEVIEKDKNFVIIDLTIINNSSSRVLNTDDFILMNNKSTITPTLKYNDYFKDLGNPYAKTSLKYQGKYNYILIYKVDQKFIEGKYTLYYTSNSKNRKIKIKPQDYNVENEMKEYKIGQEANINNTKFIISTYQFIDSINYLYDRCDIDSCFVEEDTLSSNTFGYGNKFLQLELETEDYTGYEFYEFLEEHAKIVYKISENEKEIAIKNPIVKKYKGNKTYLVVSNELSLAKNIYLMINVRNSTYKYILK